MNKYIISTLAVLIVVCGFSIAKAEAACTVNSFTANPSTVAYGGTTTVSWSTSGCDATSITPSANPDNRPASGSVQTGTLTQNMTYTIVGYTIAGQRSAPQSITITVTGSGNNGGGTTTGQCKPLSFTAQQYTIERGQGTVFHWDTVNCATTAIHPAAYPGNRPPSGSVASGAIFASTEYTLTAYDASGNIGGQRFLTIIVKNGSNNDDDSCRIDSFRADDTSIEDGDSTDLVWRTTNCDYVDIRSNDQNFNNRNEDGEVTVRPDRDTTYTIHAYPGNHTDSVRINVDEDNNDNGDSCSIVGFYPSRSFITRGESATLSWDVSGDVDFIDIYPGLTNRSARDGSIVVYPVTTTTYSMTARCGNGTTRSSTTAIAVNIPATPVVVPQPPRVIVQPSRVTTSTVTAKSAPSLLELRVESAYDRMCVNGLMDYTISYRNISSQTLENTVLRFALPNEITYLSGSRGEYQVVDRTLTLDLGNVRPGEQGTLIVHARVNDTAIRGNLTVATASVVYTNTQTRAQEDATAYALITVSDDCPNVLGATTIGFGSFLPNTLVGWLLLILVILALIVVGRQFYKKPAV